LAVREDDAEPELLEDKIMGLEEGDMVAMAVKVSSVHPQYVQFFSMRSLR
jgi:hypothetical protein